MAIKMTTQVEQKLFLCVYVSRLRHNGMRTSIIDNMSCVCWKVFFFVSIGLFIAYFSMYSSASIVELVMGPFKNKQHTNYIMMLQIFLQREKERLKRIVVGIKSDRSLNKIPTLTIDSTSAQFPLKWATRLKALFPLCFHCFGGLCAENKVWWIIKRIFSKLVISNFSKKGGIFKRLGFQLNLKTKLPTVHIIWGFGSNSEIGLY